MTFNKEELSRLALMDMPESLTDKEQRAFKHMRQGFYYASMSFCNSATFDLWDDEVIVLSKAKRFVSLKRQEEDRAIEESIRKKVKEELKERGLV